MRPPTRLILLLVPVAAVGCSHAAAPPTPPASPYYATIPDLTEEEVRTIKSRPYRSYVGHCDEHGALTSPSNRQDAVTDWVEAHNDRHHRGNGSLHWGRVYEDR